MNILQYITQTISILSYSIFIIWIKRDQHFRKLTDVGVQSAPSQAGYYIFPDFAVCKPLLATRGITTGQQMCKLIMDEKKVAVS